MGQFKPMPKMETTEPSVELKLKKGGKVKMQMGGVAPMMEAPARRGMPMAMPTRRGMAMPDRRGAPMLDRRDVPPAALLRKKGGEVETKDEMRDEKDEIKRVEKELKRHEGMKASKGHKGLKSGGRAMSPKAGPDMVGGLAGGLNATRANSKMTTGAVRNSNAGGYKNGGAAKFLANMSNGSNPKQLPKSTGAVKNGKPAGYKDGGAAKFISNISCGENPKQLPKKTGDVKNGKPAGYKDGGFSGMSTSSYGHKAGGKMIKC